MPPLGSSSRRIADVTSRLHLKSGCWGCKVNVPTLPNWQFDLDEVSTGAWKVKATHISGPTIEISGADPEALMARVQSEAKNMEAELKEKRPERRGSIER